MSAWLLNAAYLLFLGAVAPLLVWRRLRLGKDRDGLWQKLSGRVAPRPTANNSSDDCLWLHAVSVGEVLLLRPVIEELKARRPELQLVLSTTTTTGQEVARAKYPDCQVIYFPLDFTWAVNTALDRIRPTAIALAELELWPNFVTLAARRGIPVAVINGRLSERSFRGYQRIQFLTRRILGRLAFAAVQSPDYARRFQALGLNPAHCHVTGSVKFDKVEARRDNPRTQHLREAFGIAPGEPVLIAGSTQAPEERYALETWLALRTEFPNLRLVLVPRHKERFEEVARMVTHEFQLPLVRRSQPDSSSHNSSPTSPPSPVLLLDTLGELAACWGLADIAFVGGSLTRRGGQNMIEPAAYGAAVLFGPDTRNFRDIVALLLAADAARIVRDASDLTRQVRDLLYDQPAREALGSRARTLVLGQQGATPRTVDLLETLLPAAQPAARRAA
jgi:3-deoxy-D-manno-octulosonic-acid transferase